MSTILQTAKINEDRDPKNRGVRSEREWELVRRESEEDLLDRPSVVSELKRQASSFGCTLTRSKCGDVGYAREADSLCTLGYFCTCGRCDEGSPVFYCVHCSVKDSTGSCVNCGVPLASGSHCCRCHVSTDFCVFCGKEHERKCCEYIPVLSVHLTRLERALVSKNRSVFRYMDRTGYVMRTDAVCARLLGTKKHVDCNFAFGVMRSVLDVFNNWVIPQSVGLGGIRDFLTLALNYMGALLAGAKEDVEDVLYDFMAAFNEALVSLHTSFVSRTLRGVFTELLKGFKSIVCNNNVVKLCVLILKMLARFYCHPDSLAFNLMELAWDPWAVELGHSFLMSLRELCSTPVAQGSDTPLTLIMSVIALMAGKMTGVDIKQVKEVVSMLPVARCFTDGAEQLLSSIPMLGKCFGSTKDEFYKDKHPKTRIFYELLQQAEQNKWNSTWQQKMLDTAYMDHLSEKKQWTLHDAQYWSPFRLSMPGWCSRHLPKKRHQPIVVYLWGLPGSGKTQAGQNLCRVLFMAARDEGWIPAEMSEDDFSYSVPKGNKYWDGYMNQPLIRWNDFMTAVETGVDNPQSAQFMGAIDVEAFQPPRAELADKGKYLNCLASIVSSNFDVSGAMEKANINNKPAIARRVTFEFEVTPVEKAEDGVATYAKGCGTEQWNFKLVQNGEVYSFSQVANLMRESIKKSLMPAVVDDIPEDFWKPRIGPQMFDYGEHYDDLPSTSGSSVGREDADRNLNEICDDVFNDLLYDDGPSLFLPPGYTENDGEPPWSDEQEKLDYLGKEEFSLAKARDAWYEVHSMFANLMVRSISITEISGRAAEPRGYCRAKERGLKGLNLDEVLRELAEMGYHVIGEPKGRVLNVQEGPAFTTQSDNDSYRKCVKWVIITGALFGMAYGSYRGAEALYGAMGTKPPPVVEPEEEVPAPKGPVKKPRKFSSRLMTSVKGESLVDEKLRLDVRATEEMKGIVMSLVEIAEVVGKPMGRVFFVTSSDFIFPGHFAPKIREKFFLKLGGNWVKFQNHPGNFTYEFKVDTSLDMGVCRFMCACIPYQGRRHIKKLSTGSFKGGIVKRVGLGEGDAFGAAGPPGVVATFKRDHMFAAVSMPGQNGYCGALYYSMDTSNTARIVGMHVAGDTGGFYSYFAPITEDWYYSCSANLACDDGIRGRDMEPVERKGFMFEGESRLMAYPPSVSQFGLMDPIAASMAKGGHRCTFGLAHLGKVTINGETISPYGKAATSKVNKHAKQIECTPVTMEYVKLAADTCEVGHYDYVESYADVVKSINGHTGVNRSKSAGLGLGLKAGFFKSDGELKDIVVTELEDLENELAAGVVWASFVGTTLKDEKRPEEKIADVKTRIFSPADVYMCLAMKRYFEPVYRFLREQGASLGVHYAMTPEESAVVRKPYVGLTGIGFDVPGQDDSHTTPMWLTFMQFLLEAKIFENEGETTQVHPNLPPLNRTNRIRWNLLRKTCSYYLVLWDALFMVNGKLYSGSFVTTMINCILQFIMAVEAKDKIQSRVEGVLVHTDLFGDDGVMVVSKGAEQVAIEVLVAVWKLHGYGLTGYNKGSDPELGPYEKIPLCGRVVTEHELYGWTTALEVQRIVKSVCFYKKSRVSEYACTVNTFLLEASRHPRDVFDSLLDCMVWENGVTLRSYSGDYDMVCIRVLSGMLGEQEGLCREWLASSIMGAVTIEPQGRDAEDEIVPQGCDDDDNVFGTGSVVDAGESLMHMRVDETDVASLMVRSMKPDTYVVEPFKYAEKIMERQVLVASYSLNVSTTPGTILSNLPFPQAYFDASGKARASLFDTQAIMFDYLEITITTMGSGQVSFGYMAGASPMSRVPLDIYNASTGPHLIRNVASAEDAVIKVPWSRDIFAPQSAAYGTGAVVNEFNFVRLWVMAATSLESATQSSVQMLVYARLVGAKFMESGLTSHSVTSVEQGEREDLAMGSLTDAPKERTDVSLEQNNVVNYPFANWNLSAQVEGGILANKPTVPLQLGWVRGGSALWTANVRGGSSAQVAGVDSEQKFMHPVGLECRNLMNFEEMARQPSLLTIFPWKSADPVGTSLVSMVAHPALAHAQGSWNSNLAYICSCFQFYHFDYLIFRIVRIGPIMQGGCYEVSVNYALNAVAPTSNDQSSALYRVIVDLRKGADITVRIPWVGPMPAREVKFGSLTSGVPVGPVITVRNITLLTSNSSSTSSCKFAVYISAEGFKVFEPFDQCHKTMGDAVGAAWDPVTLNSATMSHDDMRKVSRAQNKGKEKEKKSDLLEQGDDSVQGGAAFLPGSMKMEYAPEVVLGPERSRSTFLTPQEYAQKYMGGSLVTSIKELLSRETVAKIWNGQEIGFGAIFDPEEYEDYPQHMQRLMEMYVYATGGFTVSGFMVESRDYDASATEGEPLFMVTTANSATFGPVQDSFGALDPIVRYIPGSEKYAELTVPRVSRLPYYVWGDSISQPWGRVVKWRVPFHKLSERYYVCYRVGEDFRAMGKNYNRSFFVDPGTRRMQNAAVLPDVVP